jgi:hypothetical protein
VGPRRHWTRIADFLAQQSRREPGAVGQQL